MHSASDLDIDEAYQVGYDALKYALEGLTGMMVAIKRESNTPYEYSTFPIETTKVANKVKYFPSEWINEAGNHVTEKALDYLNPLISGNPSLHFENSLPKYKAFNK